MKSILFILYSTFKFQKRTTLIGRNLPWLHYLYNSYNHYKKNFENTFHFNADSSIISLGYFLRNENPYEIWKMREYGIRSSIYLSYFFSTKNFSEVFYFLSIKEAHIAKKVA